MLENLQKLSIFCLRASQLNFSQIENFHSNTFNLNDHEKLSPPPRIFLFNLLLIFCILIGGLSSELLAGGVASVRSPRNCRPDFRYRAKSRATCVLVSQTQVRVACGTEVETRAERNLNGQLAAWQEVDNGPFGFAFQGNVINDFWCSRGEPLQSYFTDTTPAASLDGGVESHDLTAGSIIYDSESNQITIPNISGYITSSIADFRSSFSLIIWLPDSDQDSVMTSGKVKWEASMMYVNGQLVLNGFSSSEISLTELGAGQYEVLFNDFSKVVSFDDDVPVEDLEVYIETDGEPDAESSMRRAQESTDEQINAGNLTLSLSPNPVEKSLVIVFQDKQHESDIFDITIYDISGKAIIYLPQTLSQSAIGSRQKIEISGLVPGIYFLKVSTASRFYMSKFIKL